MDSNAHKSSLIKLTQHNPNSERHQQPRYQKLDDAVTGVRLPQALHHLLPMLPCVVATSAPSFTFPSSSSSAALSAPFSSSGSCEKHWCFSFRFQRRQRVCAIKTVSTLLVKLNICAFDSFCYYRLLLHFDILKCPSFYYS